MTSLESMIKKLKPLGLYKLENSNIYNEICAYSIVLDNVLNELDYMLKESFVQTAQDYGLELREKIFGSINSQITVEKRRQMLIDRINLASGESTYLDINKYISSLGVEATIAQYPLQRKIVVDVKNNSMSQFKINYITKQILAVMPAHNNIEINFV